MKNKKDSKLKKKILIVEDDLDMIDIYKEVLGEKYELLMTKNTAEARASIETNHVDLIILDLILPKEMGNVFLEWLINSPNYNKLKVIIVSVVNEFAAEVLKKYPKNDVTFISKPFDKKFLIDSIEKKL